MGAELGSALHILAQGGGNGWGQRVFGLPHTKRTSSSQSMRSKYLFLIFYGEKYLFLVCTWPAGRCSSAVKIRKSHYVEKVEAL